MNKPLSQVGLSAAVLFFASTALAGPGNLGTNITIYDKNSTGSSWETGSVGSPNEDNETEPGTIHTQVWDLEGMFLNSGTKKLGIIGGFNFNTGVESGGYFYKSGDIFIDTNKDAKYGAGTVLADGYNYNYVIHITGMGATSGSGLTLTSTGSYSVYAVLPGGTLNPTTVIAGSNPWTYTPVTNQATLATGSFTFGDVGTDNSAFYNFKNGSDLVTNTAGSHYYMSGFDLGFLSASELSNSLFHYTLECGNDNLIGQTPGVPEGGATILSLGAAMVALAGVRRRLGVRKA